MSQDIAIAGLRLSLICDPPSVFDPLRARYAPFIAAEGDATAFRLAVCAADAGALTPDLAVRLVAEDAARDRYRLDGGATGAVDFAAGEAEVRLRSDDPAASLETLLRSLYAHLALRKDGLLLHAAGVLRDGEAHLFIGQSGSGKSTVAALSRPALVLSDDLVIALPAGGRWLAHSTPFWNAAGSPDAPGRAAGRIAGVYKLIQDARVFLEPMPLASAAAELAANCPVVNGDPARLPELLVRCRDLAEFAPLRRLHFRKDPGFWQAIWPGVMQEGVR
jgi:hypothetical protein